MVFGDFGRWGFFLVEEDKVIPRRDKRDKELGKGGGRSTKRRLVGIIDDIPESSGG